jgi:hypothetical protein
MKTTCCLPYLKLIRVYSTPRCFSIHLRATQAMPIHWYLWTQVASWYHGNYRLQQRNGLINSPKYRFFGVFPRWWHVAFPFLCCPMGRRCQPGVTPRATARDLVVPPQWATTPQLWALMPHLGPRLEIWSSTIYHGLQSGPPVSVMGKNLVLLYLPWLAIWSSAICHGSQSGPPLSVMARNLVLRYLSWLAIWSSTIYHGPQSGPLLSVMARNLVLHYLSWPAIWSSDICHGLQSGPPLFIMARNLVLCYLSWIAIWSSTIYHGPQSGPPLSVMDRYLVLRYRYLVLRYLSWLEIFLPRNLVQYTGR